MIVHLKLLLTAVFWGGTFIAGRITAASVSPFSAAFLRFVSASIVLLLITRKIEGRLPRVSRRRIPQLVLLGLTGVFLYNFFFFSGLKLIPAGRAALIIALNPIAIALLSAMVFRERLGPWKWIGILISVVGALIVITDGHLLDLISNRLDRGQVYIFGCVISWAIFSITGKSVTTELSPLVAISYASVIGTLGLMVPAIHEGLITDLVRYRPEDWLSIIYLGFFGTAVGFVWYYEGIKSLGPAAAAQYINFVPASALFLAFVILDEPITPSLVVGLVFVIVGIYIVNNRKDAGITPDTH